MPLKRPHDIGGAPCEMAVDTAAPPYSAKWESRMWALAKNTGYPGWTLDWWRHIVERLEPETYLSIPYFEKWCLTYMTGFITSEVFTLEEVIGGHSQKTADFPAATGLAGARARLLANEQFFDLESDHESGFSVGDQVVTRGKMHNNHTRLPAYAMGKTGQIIAHHGAHVFPDLNAEGIKTGQHLYTVVFAANELWGDKAAAADRVTLDLWESYFETA